MKKRLLALASILLACSAVIIVIVELVNDIRYVLTGAAGVLLAAGGGWWVLTRRMPRRALGLAGLVIGCAVVVLSFIGAGKTDEHLFIRLALLVVVGGLALAAGRAAEAAELRDSQGHHVTSGHRKQPTSAPSHPVLICNPVSGGGKVVKFGIVEAASDRGVETILLEPGLDLEQLARDAVARGADCLGMAGGDGSQALVASIAVEHDLPFVCVSAGTRNHFALDLGIDREDPRLSLNAFRDGIERRIDYATVGDRLFVNNASLGIYATIVQQDGYRESKAATAKALLPELLGRTQEPFDLQFTDPSQGAVDGAFLIQVSNNPYVLGATLDASQRRRLDTGRLGVVAISASTGAEAAQIFTLSVLGQRRRSRYWHEFTAERFEVRSRSGRAYAGIDGEALELDTPLEFLIHPRGLRLLVPEGNLTAAEQRRARDISARDLVAIAGGRDPVPFADP